MAKEVMVVFLVNVAVKITNLTKVAALVIFSAYPKKQSWSLTQWLKNCAVTVSLVLGN